MSVTNIPNLSPTHFVVKIRHFDVTKKSVKYDLDTLTNRRFYFDYDIMS